MNSTTLSADQRGKSSQTLQLTIPAGEMRTIPATGSFLAVVEAPCRFQVSLDSNPLVAARQGTALRATGGSYFEYFIVQNPQPVTITVLIYVGFAEFVDQRGAVIEPRTDSRGTSGSLAAGVTLPLPFAPKPNDIQRKLCILTNGDPANRLEVLDAAGVLCDVIFPETSKAYPISETFSLRNSTGAAIQYFRTDIVWVS